MTHLYASVYPDCQRVQRRSRLIENRFWLIEDLAEFADEHCFTSRWWFRPGATVVDGGVDVRTPEGALLQMRCVLGDSTASVTRIDGFPVEPDGCSDRVDFEQAGRQTRWLYVLWPTDTVEVVRELGDGWEDTAILADRTYRTEIDVDGIDPVLLRLPCGIDNSARLSINGAAVDLTHPSQQKLVPRLIDCTPYRDDSGKLRVELALTLATGQDENGIAMSFPDQPPALCTRIAAPEMLAEWKYEGGRLVVESTVGRRYDVEHSLMGVCD